MFQIQSILSPLPHQLQVEHKSELTDLVELESQVRMSKSASIVSDTGSQLSYGNKDYLALQSKKAQSLNKIKQAIHDFDGKQSEETLNLLEKRFNELFDEQNVPKSGSFEKDDSFDFGYQKIRRKSKTMVELNEEMKIRQAAFLILNQYDTDRTGALDLEQFREFYSVTNASIKVVDSLFQIIDKDQDDQIDSNELFDFLKLIILKDLEVE